MLPKKYTLRIEDKNRSFIITSKAFYDFLEHNNLETKINHILGTVHEQVDGSGKNAINLIQSLILESDFPKELLSEILLEYKKLGGILEGKHIYVSFIKNGEAEKVKGDAALIHKIKEKWASLFNPHPMLNNPTLVIQIDPPVLKEIEDELSDFGKRIISNSHYISG